MIKYFCGVCEKEIIGYAQKDGWLICPECRNKLPSAPSLNIQFFLFFKLHLPIAVFQDGSVHVEGRYQTGYRQEKNEETAKKLGIPLEPPDKKQ